MKKSLQLALAFAVLLIALLALLAANSNSNPQEAVRLNNIGVAYMNQQLFQKALANFEQAAAADPKLAVATINRGVALLNLQRVDEAKAFLEQAAKTNAKDPHAWYNLGLYYKNSSNAKNAIDAFDRVTEIDPKDADTWYFLGSTNAQLRQFPQAIAAFDHALKLDPHHASSQFGLARAYQQSGQADLAREAMKKFQYITQNKFGSPISLSYGEQGKYSRAEESSGAVEKMLPQNEVKFVVAPLPMIRSTQTKEDRSPASCFIDYDNDGNIDLFLGDGGSGRPVLLHNLGGGHFEDATAKLPPGMEESASGCTVGDYDNDGFADIALTTAEGIHVLHNEKAARFVDVTDSTKILGERTAGSAAVIWKNVTFIDYDHDGDLDLVGIREQVMPIIGQESQVSALPVSIWRNNGNGTFTNVTLDLGMTGNAVSAVGSDYNNDRAVDLVVTASADGATIYENPREGKFFARHPWSSPPLNTNGLAVLDFNHDGWMDIAFTHLNAPGISLWQNNQGKSFEPVALPKAGWVRAFGVVAIDYDNDGWVDLAAVGETRDGRGEVRLFRNLGREGWKDVTADLGLDKIQLNKPRAIIAGDYDNDGAVDLLITQNQGPPVLLHNVGGNKNNSLRVALKGLNDNKSAVGTKVEVFSGGLRQKYEVYGSSGYLGQNSPYLTIGIGQEKQADVVRMLWPTGVLQDEIEVAANKVQNYLELDRRGSSCPTLFAWDGHEYQLVGDMLGAGVIGHWVAAGDQPQSLESTSLWPSLGRTKSVSLPSSIPSGNKNISSGSTVTRNIPRPTETLKLDRASLREKDGKLSFRFMEPLEESVYLDQVKLLAVDHPATIDVDPNEYFASNPPYPKFKVVLSRDARPPATAHDEHGHDLLPDLLAHRYFGDFKVLPFLGFAESHSLELDLGEKYRGGPIWLLMHGEIEYFSATSMYAADQAHLRPIAPYVEALVSANQGKSSKEKWVRVSDDIGFPAGGARTMTADLTGRLPLGTRQIRITTNLQIYWDNIVISRMSQEKQEKQARVTSVPLIRAELNFHGFPLKIEDQPPGNVKYIYEKTSATGPYTRPAGAYTRYGDVRALLASRDDKFVVFGSGDQVALDFDPAKLPLLPAGWVRDYFFTANGYEKDMDFYAYRGDTVDPLPFRGMRSYPYPQQSFPSDAAHLNYEMEYNTRFMSGNEAQGFAFNYPKK